MDSPDAKAPFRKPNNENATRNYRRHSPTTLSSPPGSPENRGYNSQNVSREARINVDGHIKKTDRRELDQTSGRDARRGYLSRYDRHSSKGYKRHDDNKDDDDRDMMIITSHNSRDKRDRDRDSDLVKNENEYKRSRDEDKHSQARYNKDGASRKGKHVDDMRTREKDSHYGNRGSFTAWGDNRSGRSSYDDRKAYRTDLSDTTKGSFCNEFDVGDYQKSTREDKKRFDNRETKLTWERDHWVSSADNEDGSKSRQPASPSKKPKFTSLDKSDHSKGTFSEMSTQPNNANDAENSNSVDAAKVAAIRAAELVNKNLVGVGVVGALSTDQKKKLLWGSKKKAVEETGHRWDASLFPDHEQQEKFNRLMSLRLPWRIVGCEGGGKGRAEGRKFRWEEYNKPRETKGATTRFRETIHCRAEKERWAHSWVGSLRFSSIVSCS